MSVGMLGEHALLRVLAYLLGLLGRMFLHEMDDVLSAPGHQDLFARLEKFFDAPPTVSDDARAGTRCFENAGGRRKTSRRHAVARDVENHLGARVEGVVVTREHVTQSLHVRGHGLVLPSVSSEHEGLLWQSLGGSKEELLDTRFTVGQAIGQERKIGTKAPDGRDPEVRGRIEGIVNRHAALSSEHAIALDDGRAAPVREDPMVTWQVV